jgi:hypothetical protein
MDYFIKNALQYSQQVRTTQVDCFQPVDTVQKLSFLSASCWFLAWLNLRPWRRRRYVPPRRRVTFNGLHGVISQKTEFFITTAIRTSNPIRNSTLLWNRAVHYHVQKNPAIRSPFYTSRIQSIDLLRFPEQTFVCISNLPMHSTYS